jgi:hypothetical protein
MNKSNGDILTFSSCLETKKSYLTLYTINGILIKKKLVNSK